MFRLFCRNYWEVGDGLFAAPSSVHSHCMEGHCRSFPKCSCHESRHLSSSLPLPQAKPSSRSSNAALAAALQGIRPGCRTEKSRPRAGPRNARPGRQKARGRLAGGGRALEPIPGKHGAPRARAEDGGGL